METQGIKGMKFQEDMTVLASMLKSEYLSSIISSNHLATRIPGKFMNSHQVFLGARVLFFHFLRFPNSSPVHYYNPTGPLAFYWEVGRSRSHDRVISQSQGTLPVSGSPSGSHSS